MIEDPARRQFIVSAAALYAGLVLGFTLTPRRGLAGETTEEGKAFAPNAFLRIAPDGSITILHGKTELGQGVHTSLPMLVAEELEADWTTVRFAPTPAGPEYNSTIAPAQFTGGSLSVWTCFDQLRNAGATARAMLVSAAAQKWGVPVGECSAKLGRVFHASSGKSAGYGELSSLAATMPVPGEVKLKDPKQWTLIGKSTKRLDSLEKVTGTSRFGQDVTLPGIVFAVVARPPVFGGSVKGFIADKALAIPGVITIAQVPSGVAVVAKDTFTAILARRSLEVSWEPGPEGDLSTESLTARYEAYAREQGIVVRKEGDAAKAATLAAKKVSAVYVLPFLAHAPMEPMNCTVHLTSDRCRVWSGTQMQTGDQYAAANASGLKPEQVEINTLMAGGGFGRRANPAADFTGEAVEVAKIAKAPVKVVWTREDDTRGGYYRPFYYNVMEGGIDGKGNPLFWTHRIVAQSILTGTSFESSMVKEGVDSTTVEGAKSLPYEVPNITVDLHSPRLKVPVLWWRSVGHSANGFTTESFIDELALLAGADPCEYRLKLLEKHPRWAKVVEVAAEKAGWGGKLPEGMARGIAVHESFGSFVAQVAVVSVEAKKRVKVHRVTVAVDCGVAVNPLTIEAQMQGGVAFGLTAALYGRITFREGKVEQGNFHNYPMLTHGEMPKVDVHIVHSGQKPGGIGEPGVPPTAPAVCNAIAKLTGQRIRRLPMELV